MKTIVLLSVLSLLSTCGAIRPGVPGSGDIRRERREVAAFDSISTEGAFQVEIVCQQPQSVEIEGDDNILSMVSTEVSNNVLHVKNTGSYSVTRPIALKISVPDLKRIHSSGAGLIQVSGLKNERLEIESNGAPTIRASGETKSLDIDASGAGKIDTFKLRAARVVVDTKGVSSVDVHAIEKLDVTVSGPSTVMYKGNAVVNETINGPGSVRKIESEGS